jgi:hypothetical protein
VLRSPARLSYRSGSAVQAVKSRGEGNQSSTNPGERPERQLCELMPRTFFGEGHWLEPYSGLVDHLLSAGNLQFVCGSRQGGAPGR